MVDFVRKHGTEAVNMIFTQFNMDDALEVRYEEGIETGEVLKIIRQISKKLQKGKSISQIADEVEESQEMVERISRAIEAAATDDVEEIYKKLVE